MIQKYIPQTVRQISLAAVFLVCVAASSSCVPLAIGAAGLAAGYIARDEMIGQVKPLGSDSYQAPTENYSAPVDDADMPVY